MKFVYQTKLSGMLEPPSIDSYRICAMKIAALCPGRTFFKGSFIKDPFRETLGLIRRAGANALERSNGSAIDPAPNRENAFKILFADALTELDGILDDRNFKEEPEETDNDIGFSLDALLGKPVEEQEEETLDEEGENNVPRYEGEALDFVLSRDILYLNGEATEDDILAVITANIINGHSQVVKLSLPSENALALKSCVEAVKTLGGAAELTGPQEITVSGDSPLKGGCTVLPASDWRIVIPGLCCSAIGFGVGVKDTFSQSPFADGVFLKILSDMKLNYVQDEDGNAAFINSSSKAPIRIDAEACGDCLPYILFIATQTDGVTEIYNITEEVLESNNHALYYTVAELNKLGAEFTSRCKGSMFVIGKSTFDGGVRIDCHNNYAVAAVAVLATLCSKKANVVDNCEAVEWVCPEFWHLFKSIGGFAE